MTVFVGPTNWNTFDRNPYVVAARCCALGTTLSDGSSLICKNGNGLAFFVAPSASQVGRTWYNRDDAVTTAQASTGCTDWFVPSCSQLITGYQCRSYWNSYASTIYWSSTQADTSGARYVNFANGTVNIRLKSDPRCVRAFRCVTY